MLTATLAPFRSPSPRCGVARRLSAQPLAIYWRWMILAIACLPSIAAIPVSAQDDFAGDLFPNGLSLNGFGDQPDEPDQWKASYALDEAGKGILNVQVELAPDYHIYSVTQPPGGPLKTKITLRGPRGVKATGVFQPNEPPTKSPSDVWKGVTVEEHEGLVIWSAPIAVPADFSDPIEVVVDGLVCRTGGACLPVEQQLTATLGAALPAQQATSAQTGPTAESGGKHEFLVGKPYREPEYAVQWRAGLSTGTVKPGGKATLQFQAKPDATFHVYRAVVDDSDSSTNFVVTQKDGLKIGAPVTASRVLSKKLIPSQPPIHYHDGAVTWSLPIEVPKETQPGTRTIEGMIAYQACTDTSCLRPKALKFTAKVEVKAAGEEAAPAAVTLASAKYVDVLDEAAETKWVDKIAPPVFDGAGAPNDAAAAFAQETSRSYALNLLFAFLGGVILNFMPCVLPVVGLKVMSFVKQAGEARSRIFALNLAYTLGILAVFGVLAALAVLLNFSWGQQFTFPEVKLTLTLVIFALALSYLGVWEIPAPSFASSKTSQDLESREGLPGAFAKGAFATVLATPCSGPLLGVIFGSTFGLSSLQTVVVMMTVGLGMAVPYLIIGIRPELVSWLPKPGAWMETLKEFLAFLFLGTVAFFFAGFAPEHKLPVFVALIGVWFGCWVIGKVPPYETIQKRLGAWAVGLTSAAIIGFAGFAYLVPVPSILDWEPYSESRLAELQGDGRTVMVDFTADWCVNCQVNYEVALDTEATKEVIDELDVVPMIADWSDRSNTEIPAKLKELRSRSIPVLAIYPGSNPNQPIILRDLVSQGTVLDALRAAGASVKGDSTQTAGRQASIASLEQ